MNSPIIAWLYVPGIRPELINKAAAVSPGVVIDLEDAVHPDRRADARNAVVDALSVVSSPETQFAVRVNPVTTDDFTKDVRAISLIRTGAISAVRVTKVNTADEAARAVDAIKGIADDIDVVCQLESARGILNAASIAETHGVQGLMIGEGDLRADLRLPRGAQGEHGLAGARLAVVLASRAAGLESPVGAAYTNVTDLDGLLASSIALSNAGFFGRSCLHPRQIPVVRRGFSPTKDEVQWAESVVTAAHHMDAVANAARALPDGTFVDPAIVHQATAVLRRRDASEA